MALVEVKEWKQIECDSCGRVSSVVRWIPLKFSKCGECGSLRIRLHHTDEERRERNKAARRRAR